MHLDTVRFQFLADALHGTGGFRPRTTRGFDNQAALISPTYLVQYPREGDAKFARRNEVAWYANDLGAACARFAGYLAKRPPSRQTDNPLLKAFIDDCNWKGDALNVFWSGFTVEAKARGCHLLLVDMPRAPGATIAEQLDARAIPYLLPIAPEAVAAIEVNEQGLVDHCEIASADGTHRGWDVARWWVRQGERIIEEGEHGLDTCPVLAFAESEFPHEGEFSQIADLARRLFNLHSELDEILRAQTFSLLTYQVPPEQGHLFDATVVAGQIGTHNMLVHSGATPTFIAPPDGPATIYLARIAALEEKIRRIGHLVEAPEQAESGVALTIRFQQLNSALAHWAGKLADLELRVWALVTRWLGLPFESVSSTWDDDYAITDVAAELNTLAAMQMAGFSEVTLAAKRQQIVALDLAGLPDDELTALLDAEGEAAHERVEVATQGEEIATQEDELSA
jgi:hypothetical protein